MVAIIRKMRHWRQRFDPKAEFIFRRARTYDGKTYQPGEKIPKALKENRRKLLFMWEAKYIELAEWEAPKTAFNSPPESKDPTKELAGVTVPDGYTVEQAGPWYTVAAPDGTAKKVNGKKKLTAYLESLDGN